MKSAAHCPPESDFGRALRVARKAKGLPQESFDQISSRTYISSLERGLKQPTVSKVGELASVLGIHPLTLLALSYLRHPTPASVQKLAAHLIEEIYELNLAAR
ncbi:transcriptional regulator with XRE-family HTH domain [Variovorax boronicumulans]|uniref:helix-turn-helix domain-containing protein n=1 Tax=Variovorax boronicumulans TaxID=436515 RepID=UPI002789CD96|nr:helix-turn-helix transcriptional regulator [Variovorax boronicumulans]MDQ0083766.1 transcriptional regulator with XRE-family HTH domain [Variovorax boronicumulans]